MTINTKDKLADNNNLFLLHIFTLPCFKKSLPLLIGRKYMYFNIDDSNAFTMYFNLNFSDKYRLQIRAHSHQEMVIDEEYKKKYFNAPEIIRTNTPNPLSKIIEISSVVSLYDNGKCVRSYLNTNKYNDADSDIQPEYTTAMTYFNNIFITLINAYTGNKNDPINDIVIDNAKAENIESNTIAVDESALKEFKDAYEKMVNNTIVYSAYKFNKNLNNAHDTEYGGILGCD